MGKLFWQVRKLFWHILPDCSPPDDPAGPSDDDDDDVLMMAMLPIEVNSVARERSGGDSILL